MMSRTILYAALVGAVSIAGVISGSSSAAAQADDSQRVFIDMRAPASTRDVSAAQLRRKAAQRGQVRVIVGLATAMSSEEDISEAEESRQRQRLRAAQFAVAQRAGVASGQVTQFDSIPFVSMWVNGEQLNRLLSDPNILNIQEDVPGTAGLERSVPFIKAPVLWQKGFRGQGWTIAVLDTGVDKSHPMFSGHKVVSEACYSTQNNQNNTISFCPNRKAQSTSPGSGRNCPLSYEPCWHGTHVAGIAAGSVSVRKGVARSAKIIAIQVFSGQTQTKQATTFDTDWIKGLERVYALRRKYKIASVNMSLGFGAFSGICDEQNPAATAIIRKLRNARIATVVAAMNDSKDGVTRSPACISEVITVGATGRTSNAVASFSNHAPWVRVMAPGVKIVSSAPNNKYRRSDGTSMASPHVAGAFALMRGIDGRATVDDIAAALECTGAPATRSGLTEPRVNLAKARTYLLSPPNKKRNYRFTNNANGWLAHAGGWSPINGFLQVTEGSGGYKVATVGNCNEGEDIVSRVWRVWSGNQGGIAGILFKSQIAGNRLSGYFAGYNSNGSFVVLRFDNYNLANDSGSFESLCSKSITLSGNSFNVIRVVSRGGNHNVFFNGGNQPVCKVTDRGYGTGRAGALAFFQANSGGNGFAVDYFRIVPKERTPKSRSSADEVTSATDDDVADSEDIAGIARGAPGRDVVSPSPGDGPG